MVGGIFEGPASICGIVVAAGLSFVIPRVLAAFPGRGGFGSATSLGFDADFSREFSGEVRLATVESAKIFLASGR